MFGLIYTPNFSLTTLYSLSLTEAKNFLFLAYYEVSASTWGVNSWQGSQKVAQDFKDNVVSRILIASLCIRIMQDKLYNNNYKFHN